MYVGMAVFKRHTQNVCSFVQCDPVLDTERMLIDLALMSDADYFVGAFSANGARLNYELMVANKGYVRTSTLAGA